MNEKATLGLIAGNGKLPFLVAEGAREAGLRVACVGLRGSCEEALAPVRRARDAGHDVWAETCTHYLFVDESALELPDFESGKFIYTPPPRE